MQGISTQRVVNTAHREGRDGTWSTFLLRVGTPAQDIRVNPSTVWPYTQPISIDACKDASYTACTQDRGQLFTPNASKTWQEHAAYPLYPELNFTFVNDDVGLYGVDTIQLGENGPSLDKQELSLIKTPHYYVGVLGTESHTRCMAAARWRPNTYLAPNASHEQEDSRSQLQLHGRCSVSLPTGAR